MTFTCADQQALTDAVVAAWRAGAGRDWSVGAGSLDWTCAHTADHAVDCVLAPAFFLASRKEDGYPPGEPFTVGPDPTPEALVEALDMATQVLVAVVTTAAPDAAAAIWYAPQVEVRTRDDFVPRAALELVLHAHDVCAGLEVPFDPPPDGCDRLRAHTQAWPFWTMPGWSPPTMQGDAFAALLAASGRAP